MLVLNECILLFKISINSNKKKLIALYNITR